MNNVYSYFAGTHQYNTHFVHLFQLYCLKQSLKNRFGILSRLPIRVIGFSSNKTL